MRSKHILVLVAALTPAHAVLAEAQPRSGPPIIRMPLSQVEPPRNVPAAEWKSPYCTKWNDGCTECTRKSAKSKTTCAPTTACWCGSRLSRKARAKTPRSC
jgi:hypothetical protein